MLKCFRYLFAASMALTPEFSIHGPLPGALCNDAGALPICGGDKILWLIRHGQSLANAAHDNEAVPVDFVVDVDSDPALSEKGLLQAQEVQ